MSKFYVTGASIQLARAYVTDLVGYGQTVVSTWHNDRPNNVHQNLYELAECDTLLVVGTLPSCFFEAGYAIAKRKRVIILGSKLNEYNELVIYMTKEEFYESL